MSDPVSFGWVSPYGQISRPLDLLPNDIPLRIRGYALAALPTVWSVEEDLVHHGKKELSILGYRAIPLDRWAPHSASQEPERTALAHHTLDGLRMHGIAITAQLRVYVARNRERPLPPLNLRVVRLCRRHRDCHKKPQTNPKSF
jgi:hypothetical protein